MKFEIVDFPWTHGYSESFVDQDRADQMGRDFPEWEDEVWDRAGKTFNTEYGHKKELTDKVAMPDSISSFIKDLESPNLFQDWVKQLVLMICLLMRVYMGED